MSQRGVLGLAIVDGGMVAQGGPVELSGDTSGAQIGLGRRTGNGAAGMEQATGGLRRSARRRLQLRSPDRLGRARQGEEGARLVERVAQGAKAAIERDQIEEIAMLAGRGIGPFAGSAGTGVGTVETDIEAAPGRVPDVARDPVAALAASVGEISAAHGLCITSEAARQIGGWAGHGGVLLKRLLGRKCA